MPSTSVRLFVILARESDVAVVFRRGPSKQVLLIRWQRDGDRFFAGQWFKGRIYERRCDLSPSGERLLYFAADYSKQHYSWTAISRPPFLTALALWPKGDCWGGGGRFRDESRLELNHREDQTKLADDFRLPRRFKVEPFGARPGWGEDGPLEETLLERHGWRLVQAGRAREHRFDAPVWITYEPPHTWGKRNPAQTAMELRTLLRGYRERGGPIRVLDAAVFIGDRPLLELQRIDWADWDANGDLLFARQACLYRASLAGDVLGEPRCLLDTAGLRFRSLPPSGEAQTWDLPLQLESLEESGGGDHP